MLQSFAKSVVRSLAGVLPALVLGTAAVRPAEAQVVFFDDFNDGVLGSAWHIEFVSLYGPTPHNVAGWDGVEAGGRFTVDTITPINQVTSCTATAEFWSTVEFSRSFPSLGDFDASVRIAWDSVDSMRAVQKLTMYLTGPDGELIGGGDHGDYWLDQKGRRSAW